MTEQETYSNVDTDTVLIMTEVTDREDAGLLGTQKQHFTWIPWGTKVYLVVMEDRNVYTLIPFSPKYRTHPTVNKNYSGYLYTYCHL